ncbi:hypothetical protein [Neorhizobium petrolearium]|uniref:hypothetical protein n=1 Tax=Neorhizobium petrolearium TaxID=515361 RepID=UPI003F5CE95F
MIAHGGSTVTLRPTLRAAATLEARHGFPTLFQALDDLSFTIISDIILTCATNRQDAAAFLFRIEGGPLFPFFLAVRQPLAALLSMLTPALDPNAKPSTGKPMTWAEVYAALYDRATGWLGWTPETAWNATPTEIDRAYSAHYGKLKAIHGSGDNDSEKEPDPEQAARNVAAGLDPEFNRSGLHALKGKGGKR